MDIKQTSERNMVMWMNEVDGIIAVMPVPVDEFLRRYVPSRIELTSPKTRHPFDVPVGVPEPRMYEPLSTGLKSLVTDFPPERRLCFHNNAHHIIKSPYGEYERELHSTRPDVIASLPGQTFSGKFPDRWRNISLVLEAKSTERVDPMRYHSKANNESLVQLSKSARNVLFAQSRLFVFAIGIYGTKARIYRFDHAGAVCSEAFDYAAAHGAVLHEFLWRFVNPIPKGCDVVGADPTVRLVTTLDRTEVEEQLRAGGVTHDNETLKACRWITVKGSKGQEDKRYLLYEVVFANTRLFSRATTVWKALEVDKKGWPTNVETDAEGRPCGVQVIIKDSWRQLARKPELEYYRQIYGHMASRLMQSDLMMDASDDILEEVVMKAWGGAWHVLAEIIVGNDLGTEDLQLAAEERVGQQTCSGEQQVKGSHQLFERSHTRIVSKSVGTPLSGFQRTREMVQALRHKTAFEAGILHRDISEGNILIANGRGFLHDLDHAFNWMAHLFDQGYEHTVESWEQYVKKAEGIPGSGGGDLKPASAAHPECALPSCNNNQGSRRRVPAPIVSRNAQREYRVDVILAEKVVEGSKWYYVKWEGYDGKNSSWEPSANVRNCVALVNWLERPPEERITLSEPYMRGHHVASLEPYEATSGGRGAAGISEEAKRMECKERIGTLYFMAMEVLEGDVIHDVRHDLESFFWLLIWLVLRHTAYVHRDGLDALRSLFDQPTYGALADKKRGWLLSPPMSVKDNKPLTEFITKFKRLCKLNMFDEDNPSGFKSLTYGSVLEVFDEALARQDWPSGDKAIPFVTLADPNRPHLARLEGAILSSQVNSQARCDLGPINLPMSREIMTAILRRQPMRKEKWTLSAEDIPQIERQQPTNEDVVPGIERGAFSGAQPPLASRPRAQHLKTWAGDNIVGLLRMPNAPTVKRPLARGSGPAPMAIRGPVPELRDLPTASARARSTSKSPGPSSDDAPGRVQPHPRTFSAGSLPLPSVRSLAQAAPDSLSNTDHGEGPANGDHRTRRKRSHEESDSHEDELGPSKRLRTRIVSSGLVVKLLAGDLVRLR